MNYSSAMPFHRDVMGQVGDAHRVAPLVVVPGDDLDEVAADDKRVKSAEYRRVCVASQVAGHQWRLGVSQDPLHRALGILLHGSIDMLLRRLSGQERGEIDH